MSPNRLAQPWVLVWTPYLSHAMRAPHPQRANCLEVLPLHPMPGHRTDDELRRVFTLLRSPKTRHASAYHYIHSRDKLATKQKVRWHSCACSLPPLGSLVAAALHIVQVGLDALGLVGHCLPLGFLERKQGQLQEQHVLATPTPPPPSYRPADLQLHQQQHIAAYGTGVAGPDGGWGAAEGQRVVAAG